MGPKTRVENIRNSLHIILRALSDGQWHQNKELLSTTKLSSRTLTKHLKTMTEKRLIEQNKKATSNGKHAVLYRALPSTLPYIELNCLHEDFSSNIDTMLKETKNNPLIILDMIHQINLRAFTEILKQIQDNKDQITPDDIEYLQDIYLETNYQTLTRILMKATAKIIDKIDIEQLQESFAKEQKEFWQ